MLNRLKSALGPTAAASSTTRPRYIYKILPHHSLNSQYSFPIPPSASHEFFPTPADAKDGFVHLCTSLQLQGVLGRFFGEEGRVTILKVGRERLEGFNIVKWESAGGEEFPHLYGTLLEGEYVDSWRDLERGSSGAGWGEGLENVRREGWLE